MNAIEVKLPNGGIKYMFEDGTTTVFSARFVRRCERLAKANKSWGIKTQIKKPVSSGQKFR